MKNGESHIYKYKKVFLKAQNKVVDYEELRKEKISKKKSGKQHSGRISLKQQLASTLRELEETRLSSEIEKKTLLEEIERLNTRIAQNSQSRHNHQLLENSNLVSLVEEPEGQEVEEWRTAAKKNPEHVLPNQTVKRPAEPNIIEQIRKSSRARKIKTKD